MPDLSDLRTLADSLAEELATTRDQIAGQWEAAQAFEDQAIAAIRTGDDIAARQALSAQREFVEKAHQLEADVIVLEELIGQCNAILSASSK